MLGNILRTSTVWQYAIIFVDALRQASGGCPAICSSENSVDKQIDRHCDRIAENSGSVEAPVNIDPQLYIFASMIWRKSVPDESSTG